MKRFPPLISPLLSLAYLFILMGLSHWPWGEILLGTAAALVVLGVAAYLSTRGHDEEGRPRPPRMGLALCGIAAFHLVSAGAASIAGAKYGAIALLAGVVPASAAMLLIATMRANTAATTDRPRDTTPSGSSASRRLARCTAAPACATRRWPSWRVCSVSPVAVPTGRAGRA